MLRDIEKLWSGRLAGFVLSVMGARREPRHKDNWLVLRKGAGLVSVWGWVFLLAFQRSVYFLHWQVISSEIAGPRVKLILLFHFY